MNCKQGELAFLIRSHNGVNTGKVCRIKHAISEKYWWVEFPHAIQWSSGAFGKFGACQDAWLRPIRPGDLEDETPQVRELEQA